MVMVAVPGAAPWLIVHFHCQRVGSGRVGFGSDADDPSAYLTFNEHVGPATSTAVTVCVLPGLMGSAATDMPIGVSFHSASVRLGVGFGVGFGVGTAVGVGAGVTVGGGVGDATGDAVLAG